MLSLLKLAIIIKIDFCLFTSNYRKVQGAVALGSSPGFEPWPRTLWVVFLAKTCDSHSASLHPGVEMGTSQLNAGSNPTVD